MSGLLNVIQISDVPEQTVDKIKAVGTVGQVSQKEVANGYVQVSVPLTFNDEKSGDERTFTARFNIKPSWTEAGFDLADLDDREKISYQINLQKLARNLFKNAGLDSMDYDAIVGERVGFTAGPQKNDPSRLEIKGFFQAK